MKNVTIAHDMNIQGYGVIKAGTTLPVEKFNSRFIYVYVKQGCILRLAYSDTTAKPPKHKQTAKQPIKDDFINDFLDGKEVSGRIKTTKAGV